MTVILEHPDHESPNLGLKAAEFGAFWNILKRLSLDNFSPCSLGSLHF
jgi:hypothetical protein